MAVEAHHHQSLRRGAGCRRAAPRPTKIPDAAQSDSESQHRRYCCQPAPRRLARVHVEAEPLRQQSEPQGEECRAYRQRGDRRWPSVPVRGHRAARPLTRHRPSNCAGIHSPMGADLRNGVRTHLRGCTDSATSANPCRPGRIPVGRKACSVFRVRKKLHPREERNMLVDFMPKHVKERVVLNPSKDHGTAIASCHRSPKVHAFRCLVWIVL